MCVCLYTHILTINPLTWKIWWAPNNANIWQTGFNSVFKCSSSSSSSLSSYICHAVRSPVDPLRSHVPRSLFKGLPWFLLPVGQQCCITLGNLFLGILFTCYIQLLFYSSNLSKIGLIFLTPLQIVHLFCNLSKCILQFFSCISSLLLLFFWRHLLNSPSFAAI